MTAAPRLCKTCGYPINIGEPLLSTRRDPFGKSDEWDEHHSRCVTVMASAASDQTIAALARENVTLKDRVVRLEEDARRRREWLDDAKRAAGFPSTISFDDVWAQCLAAYKAQAR